MATTSTFDCSLITPERAVLECKARFVAFPAFDGEMGILTNRAPLVCRMGIGQLRIDTGEEIHNLFVEGGFAQVVDNRLTLLTEQAVKKDELDRGTVEQALVEARAMPIVDDASYNARDKAMQRAQVQLKLVRSGGK